MHCLIFCAGTDGDCFPFFTVARNLVSRGHQVTVMAPPIYSGASVLQSIDFRPLCSAGSYRRFTEDAMNLAGRYGLLLCKRHAVRWNLTAWRTIEALRTPDLIVLAPDRPFFWADVAASRVWDCAAIRFQIEPSKAIFQESLNPPAANFERRIAASIAMEWYALAAAAGVPTAACSLAGLSRAQRDILRIALYPDWLIGEQHRQENVHYFGFLLPDPDYEYLEESDLPHLTGHAVFKRGRSDAWPDRFCAEAIEACLRFGIPGLFLGGMNVSHDSAARIISKRFVPLHRALENARVVLHNGGIGTAALAIKSGVPQIIVPRIAMQPIVAECMRRLDVASVISPESYTAGELCRRIRYLTNTPRPRQRSLELSSRIDSRADSTKICAFIEHFQAARYSGSELRHGGTATIPAPSACLAGNTGQ